MAKQIKVGFVSLGCSKNRIDTEVMLHTLLEAGYEITADETEADVVIINTCAFIESAKKEAIDNILDIAWLKENKDLKGIVVCGCLAERYGKEILEELPEVDAIVGVGGLPKICEAVDAAYEAGFRNRKGRAEDKYCCLDDKNTMPLGGDRVVTTPEYSAYIKVAEGCDNHCTYCVIGNIRGKFRSRPIEDIVAEAKTLEELGVKELNIVAQDTSRYGLDIYGEYSLAKLVRAITNETSIPWIRLLYCYPDKITDELCEEFKNNDRLVKYIDMPIQHISDSVLDRMNRHGGSEVIKDAISRLRRACPDITLRTTVLVGFPGETDGDFEELCEFIKEARFDRLGAFTYSAEEGTPAAEMDSQVDEQTKQDRYDLVMRIQGDISAEKNEEKLGKVFDVICEGYDTVSEIYYGRSAADALEIDGKIYFSSDRKVEEGELVKVIIGNVLDYDLLGDLTK
ncbi:MAG: 30S ribosomal protein S12 methylthiotransferase RimO [Clostridia bacterium]|nr:30S ribosomal protein S12 methylthiotransferase RimO [Clostridia bacterium]